MPLALSVQLDVSQYVRRFKRLSKAFKARDILQAIGSETRSWIEEVFRTEGSSRTSGNKWRALRPNTIASKAELGRNAGILDSTGELKRSFQISIKGEESVIVGTDTPWARFHQSGTKGPYFIFPKKVGGVLSFITVEGRVFRAHVIHPGLPRRPFMPTKNEQVRIARYAAAYHIEQALGEE